jgi:4'-phosphopantetheinyl transferase EntD
MTATRAVASGVGCRWVDGVEVIVAHAAEPLDARELTARERTVLGHLAGGHRRREWLVGRRALRGALAAAGRPPDTAGIRFPVRWASVSHSAGWAVAVAVPMDPGGAAHAGGAEAAILGVGVDLELGASPSPGAARFFLRESETRRLRARADDERDDDRLRLWTVKEALFKADRDNASATLVDYEVVDPVAAAGRAWCVVRPGLGFAYESDQVLGGVRTIAVARAATHRPEGDSVDRHRR